MKDFAVNSKLRKRVLKRDGNICYYCGHPCLGTNKKNLITLEHLFPVTDIRRFLAGEFDITWMRISCGGCNWKMGTNDLRMNQQFKSYKGLLRNLLNNEAANLLLEIHYGYKTFYQPE